MCTAFLIKIHYYSNTLQTSKAEHCDIQVHMGLYGIGYPFSVWKSSYVMCVRVRAAGDWGNGLCELHMYYWDKMTHSPHYEIKSEFSLADKSDDIVVICGTTSSNMDCVWRLGECMGLLCCGK